MDADRELLDAVEVLAGHGDEARDAQPLLAAEEQAHSHDMATLSMDGIGWHGEVLRTLSEAGGAAVEVYALPRTVPTNGPYISIMPCRPHPHPGALPNNSKIRVK